MRTFFRIFFSTIAILIWVGLILSAAIWFLGPLIGIGEAHPLDGIVARGITIGVLWLILVITIVLILVLRRSRDRSMTEEIVETAVDDDEEDEAVLAELSALKGKLRDALAQLRKTKRGRRRLYELPWYIIIGPPGAGKTTAIVNSGLQFPLAEKSAIGGVGGTRNCDWWFTDEAVLIDTAGRYTTQESDAEADNKGWLGFLGLLKKHRKRQPINGAVVAISLSDLSNQDESTQKSHAAAVRSRLNELRETLGVRFPVYVLFTKADLIAGFTEFFDDLGKEEREQVWGFTLPLDKKKGEASPIAAFNEEFGQLLQRLNSQSLEKMQAETDHQRRALIAGFPAQVSAVRSTAHAFLAEVFQDNRYQHRQFLRGVYFTSGTQEGTPIDRLMMSMARTFGIGRQALGSGQGSGRSYFLTRLFEGVMFPEAGLVSADDKAERRYRVTKYAAIAATVLFTAGAGTIWVRSFLGNQDLIAQGDAEFAAFQAAAATIPQGPVADSDLPSVVPALNILRDMPGNPTINDPEPDTRLTYGLYQGKVIGSQAAQSYRAALNKYFLPRLILSLEERMRASINEADQLYDALKIYLMIGLEGPMNTELVNEYFKTDWEASYPGLSREEMRSDLADHLSALLSQPMRKIELNGPLVEQAQRRLTELPFSQRIYNGIVNSPRARALPQWRLTDFGGPAVSRVFVRSSGKALNDGIPGVFTFSGFNNLFLYEALEATKRIQKEAWVLGPFGQSLEDDTALLAVKRDVLDLYYNDFVARYDELLSDIDVLPMEGLNHAVEVTNVLSGPTSPIVNILTAVAAETRLTEDRGQFSPENLVGAARTPFQIVVAAETPTLLQLFMRDLSAAETRAGRPAPPEPGQYVQDRFAWLNALVERPENQPSQLDVLMQDLLEVNRELNSRSFTGGDVATELRSLQTFLQNAAAIDQGPIGRWAAQIAEGSSGISASGTRASLDAKWKSEVLPMCKQITERYPFNRRSRADASIQDFSRLFGPGGLIDGFHQANLSDLLDTGARNWSWKRVNDADLGISDAVAKQFQYATEIRDAFFSGNPSPAVQFQLTPEALDPAARRVNLEIDGQIIEFSHRDGRPTPTAVTWPGSVGLARLVLTPNRLNTDPNFAKEGPWALFRLLDAAEVRGTNVPDRKRIIFNVGGRIVIYIQQSSSVLNPFQLPALTKFSCPSSF